MEFIIRVIVVPLICMATRLQLSKQIDDCYLMKQEKNEKASTDSVINFNFDYLIRYIHVQSKD